MKEFNEQEAIDFYESGGWKNWDIKDVALFQLYQPKLCVPFTLYHEAIEALLDRSVYTHELAETEVLIAEYEGKIDKPTITDIYMKLVKLADK
jgi:hypothetical protein